MMKVKRFLAKFVMVVMAPGHAINGIVANGHLPILFFVLAGLWCTVIPAAFFTSGFLSSPFGGIALIFVLGLGVGIFWAFCSMLDDLVGILTDLPSIWYVKCRNYREKTAEAAALLEKKDLQYFIDHDKKKQRKKATHL